MSRILILTGVSGSGKTTIGLALAQRLGWPFYDGDDFHPPQNIAKMARGEALDDADRVPWLQHLNEWLRTLQEQNQPAVLACSALKHAYRRLLAHGLDSVCFVYLHGSFDLIYRRMEARQGHYMSEEMLQSQFDALEPPGPGEALHVDVTPPVSRIVRRIEEALHSGDGCRSPS